MAQEKLSTYEKQRLENIQRNQELLRELQVPLNLIDRSSNTAVQVKKHVPKKEKKLPQQPTRASARLRGIAPTDEPDLKRQADTGEDAEGPNKKSKRIDQLNEADQTDFLKILNQVRVMPNTEPSASINTSIEGEDPEQQKKTQKQLADQLSQLRIRHAWATVKVTPDRINASAFHPSNSKRLACAADVSGHLGFWDVDGVTKEEDEESPVVYTYRPHTRTITDLKFNPTDPSKLITTSYDGTIQFFDMEKATFGSLVDAQNYSYTSFDLTKDGRTLWFSTSDGEVGQYDLRAAEPVVHLLRDKKIGCISLNPVHEHLLAAASNDRTASVWDVRSMKKSLHEMEHGYSVTSAYWSPKGNKLATTAYDDYVRVFALDSISDLILQSAIRHNNHTGRWVTNFRARWNENTVSSVNGLDHQHFVVGNMKHPVDVYSGETGEAIEQLYDGERITAIQAVVQFHPTTESTTLLCGNGSGRMVCWS
ncbi:hypothetical protein DFQ28_002625 [Apophysomyces sp. BC1034]|nr:hypothetical protein DFQ30_005039 [Apophysomyces sp. BC1015]KAG0180774.1 hypothetical protein DFQ29_010158 [Apophysomyces sp. BC1021]KAG0190021.1 hypothetical protein DFQ28_002625 [Apophysomyces sp. BC1034]